MVFEVEEEEDVTRLETTICLRLHRSKSFPAKMMSADENSIVGFPRIKLDISPMKAAIESKKKAQSITVTNSMLKQEIAHLEKRLQDQFVVRRTLEKALVSGSLYCDADQASVPKPATEMIREIAVLELEVAYLEQYLLSLYRKTFDHSPNNEEQKAKPPVMIPSSVFADNSGADTTAKCHTPKAMLCPDAHKELTGLSMEEKMLDSCGGRCNSLSPTSAYAAQSSSPMHTLSKDTPSCHSQPLSIKEYAKNIPANVITLAEHLGTRISDHVPETPNSISEEMVKCMATIFCKLADPPSAQNGFSSSNSSSFSTGRISPNYQCGLWSPGGFARESSFNVQLENPFNIEGLKEFSGPYSTMVEVHLLYRENQKLSEVELLLQNFSYLICRLQEINPSKMNNEEKLAFWINVHNALVMHAFLAYGVPQNNVKTMFLLLKAAYSIGGHTITADMIQSTILGCRSTRPAQWLRMIITPKTKFKFRDYLHDYAIENPEPLLHFALCSGSHSDPAIRIYTPKRVLLELEGAKDEYIRATFGMRKEQKILLPKMVELYAKDAALTTQGITEMIQKTLPDFLTKSLRKCQVGKPKKSIVWVPHNFGFRYLFPKELVK